MSSRHNPLAAAAKASLLLGSLGTETHQFGAQPMPPVERGQPVADPVREANLVLPRKHARHEIFEAFVAQRDTCLKACIEDVLGIELTDPTTQLDGHNLIEADRLGLPGKTWSLDAQPLLWCTTPAEAERDGELRGVWTIQLLRNLPDEVLAGLPKGVRPWQGPMA